MNKLSAIQQYLVDYWRVLPRTDHPLVPSKKDISLPRLAKIGPHLGITEYRSKYDLYVRLMGTEVDHAVGGNMQHTNSFADSTFPESYDAMAAVYTAIISQPMGLKHTFIVREGGGHPSVIAAMHLPLCNQFGDVTMLISTFEVATSYAIPEHLRAPTNKIHHLNNNDFTMLDVGAGVAKKSALCHDHARFHKTIKI